jgi:hypothetical protein
MVQPLVTLDQLPAPTPAASAAAAASQDSQHLVQFVDVPLPLVPMQDSVTPAAVGALGAGATTALSPPPATTGGLQSPGTRMARTDVSVQQQQQQQQQHQEHSSSWEAVTAAAAALGSSLSGGVLQSPLHTLSTPKQQQQGSILVQAVERTGAAAGSLRELLVPAQVVSALSQLQLSGAVGWLRLVRLPPPAAAAAAASASAQPVGSAATATPGAGA